jgi:CheY-like chemotaxis protein
MINATILVVEDESDAKAFTRALRSARVNTRLEIVNDADDAVSYCKGSGPYADRGQHPVPDLVVVDVKLPHGSGLQVLKALRTESSFKNTPVVMVSSERHLIDVAQAYSSGANAFLIKPPNDAQLEKWVESLAEFWLGRNIPPPLP